MLMAVVPVLSLVSTAAVFAVAGFLTLDTGVEPLAAFENADSPMVPFVAFTEALRHMWGGPFVWGMVVFVTLFFSSATALVCCFLLCYNES